MTRNANLSATGATTPLRLIIDIYVCVCTYVCIWMFTAWSWPVFTYRRGESILTTNGTLAGCMLRLRPTYHLDELAVLSSRQLCRLVHELNEPARYHCSGWRKPFWIYRNKPSREFVLLCRYRLRCPLLPPKLADADMDEVWARWNCSGERILI